MTRNSLQKIKELFKRVGLRPTRPRLLIGRALFEGGNRHLTAEDLHVELVNGGARVSLSTVYNTLHKFSASGLLKEVVVKPGRIFFDTNINSHHHFIDEESGLLYDISENEILLKHLPRPPKGLRISGVDVVIRVVKDPF